EIHGPAQSGRMPLARAARLPEPLESRLLYSAYGDYGTGSGVGPVTPAVTAAAALDVSAVLSSHLRPAMPTGPAAQAVGATDATLTWPAMPAGVTGVRLERGTAAKGPFAAVATLGPATTSYHDTGLAAG